jgi:hypothetical protein
MSNFNRTCNCQLDRESLVNGSIDPALLTSHSEFAAGSSGNSLHQHQRDRSCSNCAHDPHESEVYLENGNVLGHGFVTGLDGRYSPASPTRGSTMPQPHSQESPIYHTPGISPFTNHESMGESNTAVATGLCCGVNLLEPNPTSLENDSFGRDEPGHTMASHEMVCLLLGFSSCADFAFVYREVRSLY